MVAADDVQGRQTCRRWIHVFARDPETSAGLRRKLHQYGVGYEARSLPVVDAGTLNARAGQCPEVCYGESIFRC